jgi:hypothetical protein
MKIFPSFLIFLILRKIPFGFIFLMEKRRFLSRISLFLSASGAWLSSISIR